MYLYMAIALRNRLLVNALRLFWILIALWYELGTFISGSRRCNWPDAVFTVSDPVSSHQFPLHEFLTYSRRTVHIILRTNCILIISSSSPTPKSWITVHILGAHHFSHIFRNLW